MQLKELARELSIIVSGALVLVLAMAMFLELSPAPLGKIGSLALALVAIGILANTDRWSSLLLRWLLSGSFFTAGLFFLAGRYYGLLKSPGPHTSSEFLPFAVRWVGFLGLVLLIASGLRRLGIAVRDRASR